MKKYFKSNQLLALGAFGFIYMTTIACVPERVSITRPTETPSSTSTLRAPSIVQATVPATALPTTRASNTLQTPAVAAVPISEEEDCMAGCHRPDPSESFAAGAKPQPNSHTERTSCLTCHSTLQKPIFPAAHQGRLDPSCALCHTANSTIK